MADRDQLLALAARCEAASGPDRELDGDIYRAIHPEIAEEDWHRFDGVWHLRDPDDSVAFDSPPQVSASLDVAIGLVPEGWAGEVEWNDPSDWYASATFNQGAADSEYPNHVWVGSYNQDDPKGCKTAALAMTATALRARAALA